MGGSRPPRCSPVNLSRCPSMRSTSVPSKRSIPRSMASLSDIGTMVSVRDRPRTSWRDQTKISSAVRFQAAIRLAVFMPMNASAALFLCCERLPGRQPAAQTRGQTVRRRVP